MDYISILITLIGTFGGLAIGALLTYLFAVKKTKADIELEGKKKLAGIIAQYWDQLKDLKPDHIQNLVNTINNNIIYEGYGIFLTEESNSLLYLIKSNRAEPTWYQKPIPEQERFVLEVLMKKPFKKYLASNKKLFHILDAEYYERGSLMAFCLILLEFLLYSENKTLPPTEMILSKIPNKSMIIKEIDGE